MKTILPILLLVLLASCSQSPPARFAPYGKPAPEGKAAAAAARPAPEPAPRPLVAQPTNSAAIDTNALNSLEFHPFLPANAASAAATQLKPLPTNGLAALPPLAHPLLPTNAASANPRESDEVLPAGTINFPATDLNQVLQIYSELVNRTVLRPANLGSPLITLKTQTPLTRKEAIEAFDAVLGMNGITMINVGDKFVKAVPTAGANAEAAPFSKLDKNQLPEVGQYVSHVVQLKYAKPSEMVPVLQPFAKTANSILPIDSSQILVLRDRSSTPRRRTFRTY